MLTSTRRSISYPNPDRSDRPDIPAHILNVVNGVEQDMIYAQGTNAARISRAHLVGTFFYETDTQLSWYDDGTSWHQVGMRPSDTSGTGPIANRPPANSVPPGYIYYATDTNNAYRSDGTNWVLVSSSRPLTLSNPPLLNLNNTTAETDIINTTIPAGSLGSSGGIKYNLVGVFGRPGTVVETFLQLKFYWGGTLVTWRDGSTNFMIGADGSNQPTGGGRFQLTLRANGTAAQNAYIFSGLPGFGNVPHDYDISGLNKNTSVDQNFRVTGQLSIGDGSRYMNVLAHELVLY